MTRALGALKLVRPWQWLVLLLVFGGAAGATYGTYQFVAGSDGEALAEDQQLIPVQRDDLVTSISINGSLAFPNTETASLRDPRRLGRADGGRGPDRHRRTTAGPFGRRHSGFPGGGLG